MKVLGVLKQNDDGVIWFEPASGDEVKVSLSGSGVVSVPTPEDIKTEEDIEKSKEMFGVDDIIKKHKAR